MIHGIVTNREPTIDIEIEADGGAVQPVKAILDTGYNGHLTLPEAIINSLDLASGGNLLGMLADGTVVTMKTYLASIRWFNQLREIVVTQTEGGPLVGMALLESHRVTIDVTEGGPVFIKLLNE